MEKKPLFDIRGIKFCDHKNHVEGLLQTTKLLRGHSSIAERKPAKPGYLSL